MTNYSSLEDIRRDLFNQKITCSRLVEYYLTNIKEYHHLNAFIDVYEEEARERASVIDAKIRDGKPGKLAGMVIGIKDVIAWRDHPLNAGSRILKDYTSGITATCVQRLLDEDAIIIGRQNCDEFGMGSSNENSAFGPVRNGLTQDRVPGGSSGGSAVAVQMDMCLASIGSDTGGSVRQPAAFCGICGIKPTYSRISRYGLVAYASSFDCIGLLTRNLEDAATMMAVMAGPDPHDSTCSNRPAPVPELGKASNPYRVAILKEAIDHEGLSASVREMMNTTTAALRAAGNVTEVLEFSLLDYILPTYYILTTAEASANLSRYDGVRYGHRAEEAPTLEKMYKNTRTEGFGSEVIRRILLGTYVLSEGYYDAYYTKAQKMRRLIRDQTRKILTEYDFIVLPTTPGPAFKLGAHRDDPVAMYLEDLFTVQASVSGLPAISIPKGKDPEGLPLGLQIIGDEFSESDLFSFGNYVLSLS